MAQLFEVKSTTSGVSYFTATHLRCEAVSGLQIWCTDCGPTGAIEVFTGTESGLRLLQSRQLQLQNNAKKIHITNAGSYHGQYNE
jgi:hypothetical protein